MTIACDNTSATPPATLRTLLVALSGFCWVLGIGSISNVNAARQDGRTWVQPPNQQLVTRNRANQLPPNVPSSAYGLPTQFPFAPRPFDTHGGENQLQSYPLDQQLQQLQLPTTHQPYLAGPAGNINHHQPSAAPQAGRLLGSGNPVNSGTSGLGQPRFSAQRSIAVPRRSAPSSNGPARPASIAAGSDAASESFTPTEGQPTRPTTELANTSPRSTSTAERRATNTINLPNLSVLPAAELGTFFDWRYAAPPEAEQIGDRNTTLASTTLSEANTANSNRKFQLAEQPKEGEHYQDETPLLDQRTFLVPFSGSDFQPDPIYSPLIYDDQAQQDVYEGKKLNATQRPLIEWGRKFYFLGDLPKSYTFLGETNLVSPRFLVYGDYRTAFALNDQNGNSQGVWAQRLNLDLDLKLTSTERIHAFTTPLNQGGQFTRGVYDNGVFDFSAELDPNFDTGFFEGDLGAIMGGFGNEVIPFDLPFAVGVMPLLFQNGVWMDDAILGAAATIPARNSPLLDISNMDITFFAGFDRINSPAFQGDDDAARMYGIASFIEAMNGYFEIDYAYLEDRALIDRSYHNFGAAYSRRYGRLVSTSYRVIANVGQNAANGLETADGALLLWENSLITSNPYTCLPYLNLFAGFGRPQSAARVGDAGGVLRNTGINFESDALTGYPTLDATANDTFGGAMGMSLLSSNFDQQLVVELAMLNTMGNDPARNANGNQYAMGVRYQIPISNSVILRCDAMHGFLESEEDIFGARVELRHKF